MKIVLFNDNLDVIQVIGSAENIVADGKNVSWEGGEIRGITGDFLILDDEVKITSFEEMAHLDQKEQFQKVDLEQENKELKARLEAAELAIIDLLDYL